MKLTVNALRGQWRGRDRWISDGGSRGSGRLVARLTRDGVLLYFQHYHGGQKRLLPLGDYDIAGKQGLTLPQAREKVGELTARYREGVTDLHRHLHREREAAERAQRLAEEAQRREEASAQRGTLRALLTAYVTHLERQGKVSTAGARGALTRHVLEAAPDLAQMKAAEVPASEFVRLIGKLAEDGKGRTAAIVRAYLRAAYSLAIRSHTDPDVPLTLRSFGITANPIADISALTRYTRARDRVLNQSELQAYLEHLEALPAGAVKDALVLALLLGGQRPAQLVRANASDVDLSAATITLSDPKGARQQPRRHVLPLVGEALHILSRRLEALAEGSPLLSTDGSTIVRPETLSGVVAEIAKALVAAKQAREPFQLRDLRRTCETMLASLGVSSDVRAQLQSHGLGGVQARHYDKHGYFDEKRAALELWARHLERIKSGETAQVVPIRRRRSK